MNIRACSRMVIIIFLFNIYYTQYMLKIRIILNNIYAYTIYTKNTLLNIQFYQSIIILTAYILISIMILLLFENKIQFPAYYNQQHIVHCLMVFLCQQMYAL